MESTNLAEIQNLPIPELAEYLPELSDAELADLRKLEAASESPRKGALEAIDDEIELRAPQGDGADAKAQADAAEAAEAAAAAKAAKAAKPAAPDKSAEPAWRKQDYTGPLTGDQAAWRHAHLKPVDVERTKPVQAIKTK